MAVAKPDDGSPEGTGGPSCWRATVMKVMGVCLAGFTLLEVNYPQLSPQTQLAIFAWLGIGLAFLQFPLARRFAECAWVRGLDWVLLAAGALGCGYLVVQTEPVFADWWRDGQSLGNRAGRETGWDFVAGGILIVLVLEATRRAIGWTLPILALGFLAYAMGGDHLPDWLLPHRGYPLERTIAQTGLQSQGVFGVALRVMFTYVFLFVLFGALLKATGAIGFIIELARRMFGHRIGGAAKVSVLSSGLMGSLSGSAVANTATTGAFTIPMMRASGFSRSMAGGIEAAASSGGALVPPVMGAAAYMMLEIVSPAVTYLEIIRAAILPAVLFYLSLFFVVHFFALRMADEQLVDGRDRTPDQDAGDERAVRRVTLAPFAGMVFVGAFLSLLGALFFGFSPFRAVTIALGVTLATSFLHRSTRLNWRQWMNALCDAARDVVPLICAAACVGLIIGVVTLTGVGTRFPSVILPLAEDSLFLALAALMVSSIVLGMGLPSVVCYLLLATLIGDVLGDLGIVPLAGHMFIFYFGMLSMVTPPVALAAFAASSLSGASMMATAFAAFRISLVGFFLPYLFVYRPELLMLSASGDLAPVAAIVATFIIALFGVVAFAVGLSGYLRAKISGWRRACFFLAAGLLLFPSRGSGWELGYFSIHDMLGMVFLAGLVWWEFRREKKSFTNPNHLS